MSIEKRGPNKWRFTVSKDGEMFRKNFTGNEREAIKAHDAFKVDVDRGVIGTNEAMKFGELAQLVVDEYVKVKLKYTTQLIYLSNYNNHILPTFGNMKLSAIKPIHIQKFINELSKELKPTTVENTSSVLKMTLDFAVKWGLLKESPYRHIELPKRVKRNHNELMSIQELQVLIQAYENDKNTLHKAAFYLALGCGLRNSEIRALTTDDIDFKNHIININKQDGLFLDKDGTIQTGNISPKTDGSTRKIYAPDFVMDALSEHVKGLPYASITKQLFFNVATGKPISRHCLSKRFAAMIKDNNLPSIRFHDLRHLHATLLVNTGNNIQSVSKRLGHSDITTTLQVYTHSIEAVDKQVATSLNTTFEGIKKGQMG